MHLRWSTVGQAAIRKVNTLKRNLRTAVIGILVGIIAAMVAAVIQPSNAATTVVKQVDKPKHAIFPKTVPADARMLFRKQASSAHNVSARSESELIPNVYVTFRYDEYEDELMFYSERYDPTTPYGWSNCASGECGKIVLGRGGKLRIKALATETLVYANYSQYEDKGENTSSYDYNSLYVGNGAELSDRILLEDREYHRNKWYKTFTGYFSAALYNPAFPTPTYEPCQCGGK